jgi:S1-C subfamily serine protease
MVKAKKSHRQILMLVACISALLVALPALRENVGVSQEQPPPLLPAKQLQKLAQSITVKVRAEGVLGTGILINKEGAIYTVLTNDHVLMAGTPPYQIETPDGKIHPAIGEETPLKDNDLGYVQFRSATDYQVASLGAASDLKEGESVFAAGFPLRYWRDEPPTAPSPPFSQEKLEGFVFRTGKVSGVLDKALKGGYRVGYTNVIDKGMSGGPLLNGEGEVVAVNGIHAEPLWGQPYIYKDGSEPSQPEKDRMSRYSWGIPMETFVELGRSPLMPKESSSLEVEP